MKRLLALTLLVAACKSPHNGAAVVCSPPECPADTTLQLVAEVAPPADSAFVQQEFPFIAIDSQSSQFTLMLDPVVNVTGRVTIGSGATAHAVPATIVATRPSRIAGRPAVYYQSTVDPISGQYKLVVPQNTSAHEQYTLRVTTTDASLEPPKQLPVNLVADQSLDIAFEDPATLPELHGTVLDSLKTPIPDVQVQAIVPRKSDSDPVVVLSTTTTTDLRGMYSVRLVPNPPPTVMIVATAPTMPHLPTLMLDVATSSLGPTHSATANLQLPALPSPVNLKYKVAGISSSGAEQPVVGATCVFTADVTDPYATDGSHAQYRVSATTDFTGQASLDLIPSDTGNRNYQVSVTPDAASNFGALTTTITVAPPGGYGQPIYLPLRAALSGRVLDPSGKPLRNLTVTLWTSTVLPPTVTPFNGTASPPQTVSDLDGRFAVRLDKGTWDVGLIPPADSMLPRLWLSGTNVQSDVDLGTLMVPRGVSVTAVIRGSTGAVLGHAMVRLYTIAPDCNGGDPATCASPPRLRAEGSSSAGGLVDFLLPSQPR